MATLEQYKCMTCGEPAVVWVDLGYFVVGWSTTKPPLCLPCAKRVLDNSVNGCIESTISNNEGKAFKIRYLRKAGLIWVKDTKGNKVMFNPGVRENQARAFSLREGVRRGRDISTLDLYAIGDNKGKRFTWICNVCNNEFVLRKDAEHCSAAHEAWKDWGKFDRDGFLIWIKEKGEEMKQLIEELKKKDNELRGVSSGGPHPRPPSPC